MSLYNVFYNGIIILGGIQYYSYKPIGLGEELLVFYGEDYFEELGYSLQTDLENCKNNFLEHFRNRKWSQH